MNREIHTEELLYCPSTEVSGGLLTRVWYAPARYFAKIKLPDSIKEFELSREMAQEDIALKISKKLRAIDVFIDQSFLMEKNAGGVRKWKQVSEFSFAVAGMTAKNLGFVSKMSNQALVFLVPDSNGKVWLFGNLRNSAYMNNAEANTGKKWEDDNIISFSFTAHTPLYQYNGNIEEIQEIESGQPPSFSTGFSRGFKIGT